MFYPLYWWFSDLTKVPLILKNKLNKKLLQSVLLKSLTEVTLQHKILVLGTLFCYKMLQ